MNHNEDITVYYDTNDPGRFFYYDESGKEHTVYCYEPKKTQPSISGTSGYKKIDFFSDAVSNPNYSVTKDMVATSLWLGYPHDIAGLKAKWKLDDSQARRSTQEEIWQLSYGDVIDYLPDYDYGTNLQYLAVRQDSPYYGKYGYTGEVLIDNNFTFSKEGDSYKSNDIEIKGNYNGPIYFSKHANLKLYNAETNKEVESVKTGMRVYFVYSNVSPTFSDLRIEYTYTSDYEAYYLKAASTSNQDLVGLDSKTVNGYITGKFKDNQKPVEKISISVEKKWVGKEKESVTINLLADGTKVKSEVLNADNNWKFTFTELDKYKDGNEIVYTVSEEEIAGYDTKITGNMADGFKVVNYEKPDLTISKKVTGEAGDKTKQFTFEILLKTKGSGADYNTVNGSFDYIGSIVDGQQGVSKPVDGKLNFTDGKASIMLSHGQQITIKDLPYNIMYEVIEKEANTDNYVTTYNGENQSFATGELKQDIEVQIVNNKEFVPPTGISTTTDQGMIALVKIAVIGILMFMIVVLLRLRKGLKI
nr:Cna B-type domain-containing protein [Clostridioides difficile]